MILTNPEDWYLLIEPEPLPDNVYPFPEKDVEAYKVTKKLKQYIGANEFVDWIGFVDELLHYCPFLIGKGRPSQDDIRNSLIGRSGYKKFNDYMKNELDLSSATWAAWRKAYILVTKYSYLRDVATTSSRINKLNDSLEKFPASPIEWDRAIEELKEKKSINSKKEKAELMHLFQNLQNQCRELTRKNFELFEQNAKLKSHKLALRLKNNEANKTIKRIESLLKISKDRADFYEKKFHERK